MSTLQIVDEDNGFAALIEALSTPDVDIALGILPKDAVKTHPRTGAQVGQIATWMEFGTETVPARSFLGAWYDENAEEIAERMERAARNHLKGMPKRVAYRPFCLWAISSIRRRALSLSPPLADSTAKRKGSQQTLLETGLLLESLGFDIDPGAPGASTSSMREFLERLVQQLADVIDTSG